MAREIKDFKMIPAKPEPPTPLGSMGTLVAELFAGGLVISLIVGATCSPCMGATRSTQLEFDERAEEILEAIAEEEAGPSETPAD